MAKLPCSASLGKHEKLPGTHQGNDPWVTGIDALSQGDDTTTT